MQNVNFLGDEQRVQMVADILQQTQTQLLQLRQAMLANDHDTDDLIPDWPQEPVPTYGKRIERMESGLRRLVEANQDIADDLAEEAHRRRKQQKRQRALELSKLEEELADAEHEREKRAAAAA